MNILDLEINEVGLIRKVNGQGATRQHLLDMGVIPNTTIKLIKYAPMGDPIEFKIHGYSLTLRKEDALKIEVDKIENYHEEITRKNIKKVHPGLGEGGIYHDKNNENPLSEDTVLTFGLVGNQNSGKTTLFNELTGSNQHIGNFPGVTVDRKDGAIKNYPNTLITDLPGIYSLSPYSSEELVSRDFILNEKPLGIINVVDATTIERGLYLTMQLLELNIPMVLALNMMDEIENNKGYIDINGLEEALGIPVIPISAVKKQGIKELIEHAIHVTKYQEKPKFKDYCDENDNNGALHRSLHSIMSLIEDHAKNAKLPLRFAASKCAENDELIIDKLLLSKNEKETLEHITIQMEEEGNLDKAALMADMRYKFIFKITKENVVKPKVSLEEIRSDKIDKILTGKYTAIPSFILIMLSIFYLTFNIIGPFFQNILEFLIDLLKIKVDTYLTIHDVNEVLHSLVIDGVFEGVGSVLSFLPIIVTLFFFLSILEDSGYMARIAFVMDKLLRKIGLSGRSIVPMLIGFGCTVPAIMSTRTLPSERDRKMTILLTPFISCSAKLPIYAFFTAAFFPKYQSLVMISLYLFGILVAILIAYLFKTTIFKGEAVPFVMELPNYRMPGLKNTLQLLSDKTKDFLQRAFGIIFIATIVIWFLENFSFTFNMVTNTDESILAGLGSLIAVIFKPLGFGNYKVVVSLITGFLAKESVVSTLGLLFEGNTLFEYLNIASASSLLVFCLLYTPCVASISAIKKELGSSQALFVVFFTIFVAYIFSFLTYNVVSLFI